MNISRGDRTPAPPGAEWFWEEQATGTGPLELTWEASAERDAKYLLVVMNNDAGAGVAGQTSVRGIFPRGTVALLVLLMLLGAGVLGVFIAGLVRSLWRV